MEGIHYITEADIRDDTVFMNTETFMHYVHQRSRCFPNTFPADHDLEAVLDFGTHEAPDWSYYIADHTYKLIFWLDEYSAHDMAASVGGIGEIGHLSKL